MEKGDVLLLVVVHANLSPPKGGIQSTLERLHRWIGFVVVVAAVIVIVVAVIINKFENNVGHDDNVADDGNGDGDGRVRVISGSESYLAIS